MKKVRLFAAAVALTALALTGCSSKPKETEAPKETQAKETQAPETQVKETQAVETEAAAVETEAAVAETEAAAVETEAAAVETEAAAVETEAAVIETEAAEAEMKAAAETEEEAVAEETEEAAETEEEAAAEETEEAAETEEEAVAEETEEAAETEEDAAAEENLDADRALTYEEYADADIDTLVTIEAYVQGKQAWSQNNKDMGTDTVTIYAQDEDGGYFLYNIPCSKADYYKLKEGTRIRYTGYKSEWAGEVEVVADDAMSPIEILGGRTFIAEPVDVTDIMEDEDEISKYMNQKVAFTDLTVAAPDAKSGEDEETEAEADDAPAFLYGWDGSGQEGDDLYFFAEKDGKKYGFVVESSLCDKDSDVYKAVKELKVGDQIDLEGFLYWYEGMQPHITSVTVAE